MLDCSKQKFGWSLVFEIWRYCPRCAHYQSAKQHDPSSFCRRRTLITMTSYWHYDEHGTCLRLHSSQLSFQNDDNGLPYELIKYCLFCSCKLYSGPQNNCMVNSKSKLTRIPLSLIQTSMYVTQTKHFNIELNSGCTYFITTLFCLHVWSS